MHGVHARARMSTHDRVYTRYARVRSYVYVRTHDRAYLVRLIRMIVSTVHKQDRLYMHDRAYLAYALAYARARMRTQRCAFGLSGLPLNSFKFWCLMLPKMSKNGATPKLCKNVGGTHNP